MKKKTAVLSSILKMNIPERILLVEDIWDSIASQPESILLSDAQKKELDRRLSRLQKNPRDVISWEQAKKRILGSK